jgi:hypothetical protein
MTPSPSLEAYFADSLGHYCAGKQHCVFVADETFGGAILWSLLHEEDIVALERVIGSEWRLASPCTLIDARRLEGVAPEAADRFVRSLADRIQRGSGYPRKLATLVPRAGFLEALLAGMLTAAGAPFESRTFRELEPALEWLGVSEHADEMNALIDRVTDDAVVAALRAYLRSAREPTIRAAAKALKVSVRTLQRSLTDAGTSFRAERSKRG